MHQSDAPAQVVRLMPIDGLRLSISLWPLIERRAKTVGLASKQLCMPPAGSAAAALRWASLYELDLPKHLAAAAVAFDMDRELIGAARQAIPIASLVELSANFEKHDRSGRVASGELAVDERWMQAGYLYSLRQSLRALFVFSRPINLLLAQARSSASDRALLDAIRIDPMVLIGPTACARHSQALLQGDRRWQHKLADALESGLSTQQAARERSTIRLLNALQHVHAERLPDRALKRVYRMLADAAQRDDASVRQLRMLARRVNG